MATVLNGALNAVLAARPDPAHALGALAEELRRSSPVAPKPAPPMPKATSAEEVALQQAMQRLQQAVQSAMGTLTAVRERTPPPAPSLTHALPSRTPPSAPPTPLPHLLPVYRAAARMPRRRWRRATAAPRCFFSWSTNRARRRAASFA